MLPPNPRMNQDNIIMHNQFQAEEHWTEDNPGDNMSHQLQMNNQIKKGAATSTNFMNNNMMNNQQFKMSMLRSVQQNMPMMPNVSNSFI